MGVKVQVTAPVDSDKILPALTGSNPPDILVLSGGDLAKSYYTVNSQPMIDALDWQQQFFTKYGADNIQKFASSFGEYSSPDAPFYAGKVAIGRRRVAGWAQLHPRP